MGILNDIHCTLDDAMQQAEQAPGTFEHTHVMNNDGVDVILLLVSGEDLDAVSTVLEGVHDLLQRKRAG